jgi:2-polyprenyl-6-hydroxyphenyl methylase/3-demethylubiquinone-9 3-methyltransferase
MTFEREVEIGQRFEFGGNWARFLEVVDDKRIQDAENSLKHMLGIDDLKGTSFLDIGCGSGLFSLAARRLGASVYSFDFDPQSVACAAELKRRYFDRDGSWHIEKGSVLDLSYMEGLGKFDVVYSWGVLHHTGAMWLAIDNAVRRVSDNGGRLFIAIYNDQGWKSHVWWLIKSLYNRLPRWLKAPFVAVVAGLTHVAVILKYTLKLRPMTAIAPLLKDERDRGMSAKYDKVDWIGGFPYEFVAFETLADYLSARGFSLVNEARTSSWGCNELSLRRIGSSSSQAPSPLR